MDFPSPRSFSPSANLRMICSGVCFRFFMAVLSSIPKIMGVWTRTTGGSVHGDPAPHAHYVLLASATCLRSRTLYSIGHRLSAIPTTRHEQDREVRATRLRFQRRRNRLQRRITGWEGRHRERNGEASRLGRECPGCRTGDSGLRVIDCADRTSASNGHDRHSYSRRYFCRFQHQCRLFLTVGLVQKECHPDF